MKSQLIVQKFSKVAYIVTKVLMIIMFVCAGIMLASAVMMLAFSSMDIVEEALASSLVEFELDFNAFEFGIICIAESIVIFADAMVFMYAKNYFKNELADGTPFTHRGANELKFLGIRIMAWPLGAITVSSIICAVFGLSMDFESSVNVALGVGLIFLSFVFHHGAELKEKADNAESAQEQSFETHDIS